MWPTVIKLFSVEPIEFEKWVVEVEDFKKLPIIFRKINGMYPNSIKKNLMMSTCDQWDSETLRYWPIMPKNLPRHCIGYVIVMSLLARCQRGWITNFVGLRTCAEFMHPKSSPSIRTPKIMEERSAMSHSWI